MKYVALTLIALATTFTTPTVASAAELATQETATTSSSVPAGWCNREISQFFPWCRKGYSLPHHA